MAEKFEAESIRLVLESELHRLCVVNGPWGERGWKEAVTELTDLEVWEWLQAVRREVAAGSREVRLR